MNPTLPYEMHYRKLPLCKDTFYIVFVYYFLSRLHFHLENSDINSTRDTERGEPVSTYRRLIRLIIPSSSTHPQMFGLAIRNQALLPQKMSRMHCGNDNKAAFFCSLVITLSFHRLVLVWKSWCKANGLILVSTPTFY